MKKYNIAISCVGTRVGQSIIDSCNLSRLPIKTFGFGNTPLAYGLYDCDEYVYTPNVYQENYIDDLIKICIKYKIDLIIPGMDDEAHFFSKNINKFNNAKIKVIVAGENLLNICRDKERMSNELNQISDVFVKSYNKEDFVKALKSNRIGFPVIAKPRGGYGSVGIEIINNESEIKKITFDHIIQELAIPNKKDPQRQSYLEKLKKNINSQVSEISIQLVSDQDGNLIGQMTSWNKLQGGVPVEIIPYENDIISKEINKLYPTLKKLGLKGPLNLQGRITDLGLKLFELNARFTGITGLRAHMGFNEVEACIIKWLNIDAPSYKLVLNHSRFGIRQSTNKSINLLKNDEVNLLSQKINGTTLKIKRNILITGATGFIGTNLIKKIISNNKIFNISAFVRNKKEAAISLPDIVQLFDNQDLINGTLSLGNIDYLIHAGFSRLREGKDDNEIAKSLLFTSELFQKAISNQVPNIINISSQSIYTKSLNTSSESFEIAPKSTYGIAKYSSELLLNSLAKQHKHINYTSLRLCVLSGRINNENQTEIINKLVAKSLNSEDIKIEGEIQTVSLLDIRDAIDALISILESSNKKWKTYYNLGSPNQYNLKNLTEIVVDTVSSEKNIKKSKIKIKDMKNIDGLFLDSQNFYNDFKWVPKHSVIDTIKSLIK